MSRRHRLQYSWAPLALIAVIAALATVVGWDASDHLSNRESDFNSSRSESHQAALELDEAQPAESPGPPDLALIVRGRDAAVEAVGKLERLPQVKAVSGAIYPSRNERHYSVLAWLKPNSSDGRAAARVARAMRGHGVLVGGATLIGEEFNQQVKDDLRRAELIALPLLLLVGFMVFRSAVAALLPLVIAGFAATCALALIELATNFFPVSIFALNIVVGLAVGLGVDYSLLMVSRFREELRIGGVAVKAAAKTLRSAGRTVAFSSAAIAVSFSSLLVFPIPFVRSIGVGGILVALIAGLAAVVALPPLFVLLGQRVNSGAPRSWKRGTEGGGARSGSWYRLARFVMRRPVPVAAITSLFLIALAVPTLSMRFTGFDVTSLPASSNAREFSETAKAEFREPLLGEILVALHGPYGTVNPLAARIEKLAKTTRLAKVTNGFKHSPRLWQLDLNPTHSNFSSETTEFVDRLRGTDQRVTVTGETAAYMDTASALDRYLPRAVGILLGGTFLFLVWATRSLVLPVKALIMNMLSLGAAFGLLVLIFQDGRLESLMRYDSQHAVVLALPIVLASGAFGLLTDYGLFLLMRIKEAREAGQPDREAIATGLEKTGRTITAAAVMFAAAVGSFATSGVVLLKESALGIAVAVLLDAFVVRPLLVPSLMAILGRWNWWPGRLSSG